MRIGLILPQGFFNEFEDWPADKAWQRILAIAQLAERLGFDSLWTGEHVLARWGGSSPAFDCWTLGAALAASVPRVGIGFIVINSTFRNPVLTAKAAATLDAVSGGRLTLGLGAGFIEAEARAVGLPFPSTRERLEMLEEHFSIISRLTSVGEDTLSFDGRHARADGAVSHPHGVQRPHIPLLIGGHGPKYTYRIAARCQQQYVEAGRALGVGHVRIALRHILPGVMPYLAVYATLALAQAILTEAALSFLGLGVQMPIPSWGGMMTSAQSLTVLEDQPWLWIPAGVAIAATVLGVNFVGDGLRDAFDARSAAI